MADDVHGASGGFFSGTIFEGGLLRKSKPLPAVHHEHEESWYEWLVFEYLAEWGISRALSLWITFVALLFKKKLDLL